MGSGLPRGEVTFVFTDIESSTALFRRLGGSYADLLESHRRLIRSSAREHGGIDVSVEGDSTLLAFPGAAGAVDAALAIQRAMADTDWPGRSSLRVRIGIHTGHAVPRGTEYVSLAIHQAARILACTHGGQIIASEATREALGDAEPLLHPLGRFSVRDFEGPTALFEVLTPGGRPDPRAPRALPAAGHNLDLPANGFLGRADDVTALLERLKPGSLVTVVGPGGVGKTRLASELGASTGERWPGGVWMVALAPVADGARVGDEVAAAVGASTTDDPVEAICEHVGDQRLLLIFDNCEHLRIDVGDVVSRILSCAPNVSVIATSREPLGMVGEKVRHLRPLAASDAGDPAVELFVERATDLDDAFQPSDAEYAAIGELVERLDRLPLAIELAAARTKVMPPSEISARLTEIVGRAPGAEQDGSSDQQTLWQTLEWSYGLLSERAKRLLELLSVFVGGFDLSTVQAVGEGFVVADDVLELTTSLVNASLCVGRRRESTTRFELLATVRMFAGAKLEARGLAPDARTAHARHFETLCSGADDLLKGPDQAAWLSRLRADEANLDSAVAWLRRSDPPAALALTSELARFWFRTGQLAKGTALMRAALQSGANEWSAPAGRIHQWLGFFSVVTGDLDEARRLTDRALEIGKRHDDTIGVAYAYNGLGAIASQAGRPREAVGHWGASVEMFERAGSRSSVTPLFNLGYSLAELGEWAEAERVGERLTTLGLGDRPTMAMGLLLKAYGAFGFGDIDRARHLCERSLALFEGENDIIHAVEVHVLLMEIAETVADVARARAEMREAIDLAPELELFEAPEGKIAWARIELRDGRIERAAEILAECLDTFDRQNRPLAADLLHESARIARHLGSDARSVLAQAAERVIEQAGVAKRRHIDLERAELIEHRRTGPLDIDGALATAVRMVGAARS